MKMKYFQLLILLATILSSGCSVNDTKPISETQIDAIELEQLANIAYDNESWEEVIRYYRMLTNKISNDEKLWYRLGNAYAQINNTKSAIDAYKTALTINSNDSMILHNLAITQLQESTKTFLELEKYTGANDPLNLRARLAIKAIATLLNKEYKIEIDN